MYVSPEAMHPASEAGRVGGPPLPANWNVLYGRAGLLAEGLLRGDTDDDAELIAYNLYVRISCGEASASDLSGIGIQDISGFDLSCDVVSEGVRLLREVWAKVETENNRAQSSTSAASPFRYITSVDAEAPARATYSCTVAKKLPISKCTLCKFETFLHQNRQWHPRKTTTISTTR